MITQRTFGSEFDDLAPSTNTSDENPFSTMMASFDVAAARLGLDPDLFAILRKPDREIHVSLPITLDDGTMTVFEGCRVQHNAGKGPYFGPLRIHGALSIDELRALAGWMTWKCSLLDIPFGGSAGGIRFDTTRHSDAVMERAVRRFVSMLVGDIGQDHDVFSSDRATDSRVMAWVMDTVSLHSRFTENGVVCGKPLALGGTLGNSDAVAMGIRVLLGHALPLAGLPERGARIMIQGFGTRGGNLTRLLSGEHVIVGISDVHGALYAEKGLDAEPILAWGREHGDLRECTGAFERMTNEEMLRRPCDVFIPCAVDTTVNRRTAPLLHAKLVIEAAHGSITANADQVLEERGVIVVPDILATGGGAIVNYFEWVQNRVGYSWQLEIVHKRMARMLDEAWTEMALIASDQRVSLRTAAHMLAVRRVAAADRVRGLYA
jgi:glutamate dehydrogenase (NAD(P)+)